jgi:hypothetical protein
MKTRDDDPGGACARAEAAAVELLSQRRRLMASAVLVAGSGLSLTPMQARAAETAMPSVLKDLDSAALALFDAAEASQWARARTALARARSAANAAGALEAAFTQAGGELHRYFQARIDLTGDLIEAGTALSVNDRRWLVSSADRIAARAGELSQPFAGRNGSVQQRIDVLLFLARRTRRALVWTDEFGYRSAHDDFKRLWQSTASELPPEASAPRRALDEALQRLTLSRSTAAIKQLHDAVAALRKP